jgi:hypothetical protein
VTQDPYGVGLYKRQRPEVFYGGGASVGGIKIRLSRVVGLSRVSPPDGVYVEDDEPPAGQLDAVGVSGLAVVLVPVDVDDSRSRLGGVRPDRPEQFGPDRDAVEIPVGDVGNLDSSEVGLDQPPRQRSEDQQDDADQQDQRGFIRTMGVEEFLRFDGLLLAGLLGF